MSNSFYGKTVAVINDLSVNQRKYLFSKTKELKNAIADNRQDVLEQFKINDSHFGIYSVFLEDSTRTRESFINACSFHGLIPKQLATDSSSFNKQESYADTFNMLTGYNNNIFIIRSKLEGVCRWLEKNAHSYQERLHIKAPIAFINGGDGQHEHPTQELLDDFTFLEDNNWSYEHIHIALIGDLFHGRTTHSKAHGLSIFQSVEIDLIAPSEISMPQNYIDIMKKHNFTIRVFESIDAYVSQEHIASKWYFTRLQLERMGDTVLKKEDFLRNSVTLQKAHLSYMPETIRLYHPLPRHKVYPVIPTFLDETIYNAWERQAQNGYFIRIVLISALAGIIGDDCLLEHLPHDTISVDDHIEEVSVSGAQLINKQIETGIKPIQNGIVIDHICKNDSPEIIREHMHLIVHVMALDGIGGEWVAQSHNSNYKGIIFRPGFEPFDTEKIQKLAAISPGCTLNIIINGNIYKKYRLHMPHKIIGINVTCCKNNQCIASPIHCENVQQEFIRNDKQQFVCQYCDTPHSFKEIWNV